MIVGLAKRPKETIMTMTDALMNVFNMIAPNESGPKDTKNFRSVTAKVCNSLSKSGCYVKSSSQYSSEAISSMALCTAKTHSGLVLEAYLVTISSGVVRPRSI